MYVTSGLYAIDSYVSLRFQLEYFPTSTCGHMHMHMLLHPARPVMKSCTLWQACKKIGKPQLQAPAENILNIFNQEPIIRPIMHHELYSRHHCKQDGTGAATLQETLNDCMLTQMLGGAPRGARGEGVVRLRNSELRHSNVTPFDEPLIVINPRLMFGWKQTSMM